MPELASRPAAVGRSGAVDAAKTFAIAGVLLIHASAVGGFAYPVGSPDWCGALFWGSLLRCAVPVFFLCSGSLLLAPEKEVSPRRVWTHYLPHILLALLFWAAAYEVWALALGWHRTGVLELSAVRAAAKNWLLFHHKPHLYYLHILLLVYALLPVTRAFVRGASRRELDYFLLAWLVLGVALPALRGFRPFSQVTGIPTQWPLSLTYAAVGYTVLGRAVAVYGARRPGRQYAALFWAGFALTFGATLGMSLLRGKLYGGFLEGCSPGVAAQAVGLYGWCVTRFSAPPAPFVQTVSKASFCVYLTHLFFLDFLADRGLTAAAFPPLVAVPAVAAVLFACGFAVWLVLRRIPLVNRWLI